MPDPAPALGGEKVGPAGRPATSGAARRLWASGPATGQDYRLEQPQHRLEPRPAGPRRVLV